MHLSDDLKKFIELLNSAKVEYLIVGAWSVAFHARPRYTGDLDIFLDATPDNAARVLKTLDKFGFGNIGLKVSNLTELDQIVQLGVAPNRVDLLTSISGVTFSAAWNDRKTGQLDGIETTFISREHLIQNKLAVGRSQDMTDIELLRRIDDE